MEEILLLSKKHYKRLYQLRRNCFPILNEKMEQFVLESYYDEKNWYGLFIDGLLVSVIWIKPFKQNLYGHIVNGCGLGSVLTDSNYRNRGLSKKLIEYALKIMKERKYTIVSLAPFLQSFYEKFGFSNTLDVKEISYDMNKLEYLSNESVLEEATIKDCNSMINARKMFLSKYNLYCQRDESLMAEYMSSYNVKEYDVRIKDDKGYVVFKVKSDIVFIAEIVFENVDILDQLLAYIYNVYKKSEKLSIFCPSDNVITDHIKAEYNYVKIVNEKMSKIIDVKLVLSIIPFINSCTIKVEDTTFEVDNREIKKVENCADAEFDIKSFTQFALGARTLDELALENRVIVRNKKNLIFEKKTVFENEVY